MSEQETASRPDRRVLYATVSITGAAVMILELLGTRIIGPFYGVSLYVWTSLISVALIALALGYWLGGVLADRAPRFRIAHAVGLAGLLCALIPPAATPVLSSTNALGLRGGAFTSALILFSLPLTLLGMVGPLVIQRSTRRLAAVGKTSGMVYAISTVGSVVGTLLFGFFLLPAIGSRTILFGLSGALILLAVLLVLIERKRTGASTSLHPFVVAGGVALFALVLDGRSAAPGAQTLVFESESPYGRVRVIDDRAQNVRWLLSDSSTISAATLDAGRPILPYLALLGAVPGLRPGGTRALLVGLGGGFLPRALAENDVVTDCIEIDQAVADAARDYFGFQPTGKLIIGDGRYEIRGLGRSYDFVFHDCFTGGSVPSHLLSVEVIEELRGLMRPGGILALNFFGFTRGEDARALAAVHTTIAEVFPEIEVLAVAPVELCDVVFLASDQPIDLGAGDEGHPPGWLASFALDVPSAGGFVITDDFNPLEHMQTAKAEAYRDTLVARLGLDVLGK